MSQHQPRKLEGKIVLITGGNSGIGLATAKLYVEHGAKVIVTARSENSYSKAKSEYGTLFDIVKCDVSDVAALDSLYAYIKQKYQRIDILFANAGISEPRLTVEFDVDRYDRIMNTNVKGVFFTVAKALPILSEGSSVILNGSALGEKGRKGASVYAASKAALRSFVRTWTAEIPPAKVRFNVLSPGFTKTPLHGSAAELKRKEDIVLDDEKLIPAKRFAESEEIAAVALFLASSDSSYINGANIVADGGFSEV